MTGELVRLELPAEPAFVGLARSVVVAVASAFALDEDRLEDLRLAVSEACTTAFGSQRDGSGDRIVLRCSATPEAFEVCIETAVALDAVGTVPPAPGPDAPPNASEQEWGVQLIEALVDEVGFRRTSSGTAVDLVVRLGAATV